jgi:PAS domain S-box-containing protein
MKKPARPARRKKQTAAIRNITRPVSAAEALAASEVRYRRLFEAAKDGILILDAETGMILDVNPFLIELLGFSREEFLGKRVWELGAFKDIVANQANFEELQQKEYIRYENLPLEAADGRRIGVEFVSNVYRVNHHKVIQCNIRDVTERKRAAEALRESEIKFRTLVENIPQKIFIKDRKLRWVSVNENFARDLGMRPEEVVGKADFDFFPKDLAEKYRADDERIMRTGRAEELEERYVQAGREVWVNTIKTPVRNEKGEVTGVFGIFWDITERKRAEQRMADALNFNRTVLHASPVGIVVFKAAGPCISANEAIGQVLGGTPGDVLKQNFRQLESWKHSGMLAAAEAALAAQGERALETQFVTTFGRKVWLSCRFVPFQYEGERHLLLMANNIAERKEAELALRESQALHHSLVEQMPAGVFRKDAEGRFVLVNSWFCQIRGMKAEEMLGKTTEDLVAIEVAKHGGTTPEIIRMLNEGRKHHERIMRSGEQIVVEEEHSAEGGGKRYLRVVKSPVFDFDRKIAGSQGVQFDVTELKRTAEALQMFRYSIDQASHAVFWMTRDGGFSYVNDEACRSLGYTREELLRLNLSDIDPVFPKELGFSRWESYQKDRRGGVEHLESVHRRKDGTDFPVEVTSKHIWFGDIELHVAYVMDITERKRAEARIHHMNRIYAVLSDINQAIVRERDTEAMFAAACRIAVERGGFRMAWIGTLEAEIGRLRPAAYAGVIDGYLDRLNMTPGEAAPGDGPTATVLREGGHFICNDIEHDPQMGHWRDEALRRGYRACASFALKGEGNIVGTFNLYAGECGFFNDEEVRLLDELATDISFAMEVSRHETERRWVEEAHGRLAIAVEQAAEIIVITDADATILYVNPAFEKVTGYSKMEAVGQNPRFLKSGKQNVDFYRQMWETLALGKVWKGRITNKKKDGTPCEMEMTISPIRDTAGKIINYVAVQRDVTQEAALESQLRQSQKMEAIGQLSGGVAHDFNNILTVVQMHASLLESQGHLPQEARESAGEIARAADRATNLTRQLLTFSRRQAMQARNLDLNEVVANMTQMLHRILGEDIRMDVHYDEHRVPIHADIGMMEQILLNLTVNSRDAMPKGGRLVIETSVVEFDEPAVSRLPQARVGSFACLTVSDTGVGIPPEILPHIFEPFFTTKDVGKGTGLGMATVYGIVQQHHGWINVYSEVGQGTTFRVYLPHPDTMAEQKPAQPALSSARGGNETILLVEDESALRILVRDVLTRLGYRVLEASTGLKALAVWKQTRREVHLLLTDLVMPDDMTGMELAQQLLQDSPQLKVIYTSGYSQAIAGKNISLQEGVNFLPKPFDPFKLAQTVRASLDGK